MKYRFLAVLIIYLITAGCVVFNKISQQNVAFIYDPGLVLNKPQYFIFHKQDSTSVLYVKIASSHPVLQKNNSKKNHSAAYHIQIMMFDSYQSKIIMDSTGIFFSDTSEIQTNKDVIHNIPLKLKANVKLLKIIFTDIQKHSSSTVFLNVIKDNNNNNQHYLLLDTLNNPVFHQVLPKNLHVKLQCSDTAVKRLYVNCYFKEFPIAGPPFSKPKDKPYVLKADSSYIIEVCNGVTYPFRLKKKGMYYFRQDTIANDGFTLFHFYEDFPYITTPIQMLLPLRYITSKKEYNDLILSKDKKLGVEAFWIQIAGNSEKAKSFIKKYYNLVQDANYFFTSYQEGWKTDRGIIYIVYGPPDIVYKTDNMETWIYGEENNNLSTKFYFYKVNNRFTDNDYSLSKSDSYRDSWYMALSKWRKE